MSEPATERKPRIQPGRRTSITQALELQAMTFKAAQLLSADVEATSDRVLRSKSAIALSSTVKSWETLEDRKRILKGLPLPGSKRPAVEQPKRSKATPYGSPTET